MKRMRWFLLPVLAAVLGNDAFAQVPETERTLVTDPDVLESMGFPRDATNVYRAKNLDRVPSEAPDDFGSDYHFTAISPAEFLATASSNTWFIAGGFTCTSPCQAYAGLHLPTGVRIDAIRWWALDSNAADDLDIRVYEVCQPGFGAGEPVTTLVASGQTSGSAGYQSGVLGGGTDFTVNNRDCTYRAEMELVPTTPPNPSLYKLRVQWSRQVSPAPSTATFADVPTNHPFFQYIEALAASGITAGCGGGNYCPDNPLTRGQMAVFLSIALGLHFP